MGVRLSSVTMCVVSACLAFDASAQSSEFNLSDHTYVWNGNEDAYTYQGLSDDGYHEFLTGSGQLVSYSAAGNFAKRKKNGKVFRSALPHNGDLVFPLSVGAKWESQYVWDNGSDAPYTRTKKCEAHVYKEVKHKYLGKLEVFKILCMDKHPNRPRAARIDIEYAPSIGRIVKWKSNDFQTTGLLKDYKQ